jgi:Ca2+-binding RTX toxin-like protein
MAFIEGTNANDTLIGTAFDDFIDGRDGSDPILAGDGNDEIFGGQGRDIISGENGDDRVFGYDGNDLITGGDDNDYLIGGGGNDKIFGKTGNDFISGDSGDDVIRGDSGRDVLDGGTGNDIIDGGSAAGPSGPDIDTLYFFDVFGSTGVTVNLATGIANDGSGGTDQLIDIEAVHGTFSDDVLIGGNAQNDDYEYFFGYRGNDTIDGGSGYDEVDYFIDNDAFFNVSGIWANLATGRVNDGLGGIDHISNIELIYATAFGDYLRGSTGDDIFHPYFGNDTIIGGIGVDSVIYASDVFLALTSEFDFLFVQGIDADLERGTVIDVVGSLDTLTGVENLIGSFLDDQIRGRGNGNLLEGLNGDDILVGRAGNDTCFGGDGRDDLSGGTQDDLLNGGRGSDFLSGGQGADIFAIDLISDWDTIRDFDSGIDKIDVSAYGFASGADVLALAAARGSSVIITLNPDSTIELANTSLAGIAAADFIV